jgi:hypothetical protein
VGRERHAGIGSGGPPAEAAVGEPFRAQPNALAIVGQEFEGCARAVAKDINRPAQGSVVQYLATEGREPLYSLPEVDGVHGQKDATLRRELEPQRDSKKVCSNGVSAGAPS